MSARAPALILGVDGGGTHTRARIASPGQGVLGSGESGTSNQATSGPAAAVRAIVEAVAAACAAAGCRPTDIGAACFGLAGLDRPGDEQAFAPAATQLGLRVAPALVNDAVIAWAGATAGAPGIAVIAGTGSIAYGRGARGRSHRAGGWGGPFGDEGSAYWIGTRAIARVLRGIDGRDPPSALAQRLAAAAGLADPADLCLFGRVERPGGVPMETAIGSLAPAVAAAAAEGDPDGQAILRQAGHELADLAHAVAAVLGPGEGSLPVHGLGSVLFGHGGSPTAVAMAADARLRALLGVPLRPPLQTALTGALILAYAAAAGEAPVPADVEAWGPSA